MNQFCHCKADNSQRHQFWVRPGRAGREFPDAEQPADGIERGGDMHVGMSTRTAGNCT